MEAADTFTAERFATLLQQVGYDTQNALHLARAAAHRTGKEAMTLMDFLSAMKLVDRWESQTGRMTEEGGAR